MEKVPMTLEGKRSLDEELKRLKSQERPMIIREIEKAREHGDLSENAEYKFAKEKQSFIEGKIREIEDKLARANVIDIRQIKSDKVMFGATVKLLDTDTNEEVQYKIVGLDEADIKVGKISVSSPVARSLLNKAEGDIVSIVIPKGKREYEILKVEYI